MVFSWPPATETVYGSFWLLLSALSLGPSLCHQPASTFASSVTSTVYVPFGRPENRYVPFPAVVVAATMLPSSSSSTTVTPSNRADSPPSSVPSASVSAQIVPPIAFGTTGR